MSDQLDRAHSYGNVPANIGYNPYWGWRWLCTSCNSQGSLLAFQVPRSQQGRLKIGSRSSHRCAGCRSGHRKIIYRLTRAEAFHRNDIFWRETNLNLADSISGF